MLIVRKHIAAFLFSTIFIITASAQVTGVRYFSINNDGDVKFLCLTKMNQFLLCGTTNGLYRFDGKGFKQIPFLRAAANKAITAIGAENNKLWVGFQNGELGFVRNGKVELLHAEEGHPAVSITSIVADNKGTVYFATAGEGIYYYKNNRFFNINNQDEGLSDDYVYQLLLADEGVIATTDRGLNIINISGNNKNIVAHTDAQGLPDNIVRCIYPKQSATEKAMYWIGMQDAGIGSYSTKEARSFAHIIPWQYGQVNSLLQLKNQVWAATESKGIAITEFTNVATNKLRSFTAFTDHFSRAANLVSDDEGNVWFTANDQLIKTNGGQFQNIIPFDLSTYDQVHTILADSKGNIWLNQNNGLRRYSFNSANNAWSFQPFNIPSVDKNIDITSLYEDKFGHLWVGTLGKGVFIIDPGTGKTRSVTEDELLLNGSILSINGKGNQVWITSLGGTVFGSLTNANTNISSPVLFTNYSKLSGIGSNYVYTTLVDKKNRVWFATDGKGISVLEGGKFKNYNDKNGIKSLVIYTLCEDNKGNIWFSTLNSGIYRFDGKSFKNFSTEEGLNDQTITSLDKDALGNIIAVSKKGINIINSETFTISYADVSLGINEINTDLKSTSTINGETFFVTAAGIIRFVPSYKNLQPSIVLENVQLFLNDVDTASKKKFDYDENNLSFYFTGISFSHPDKVHYQYKLDGFTNDWLTTQDDYINFPKLPAGRYTFRVKASLNNQFQSAQEVAYSFVITKPFWLTWWFIALCLFVIVAGIYLFIKRREKSLKRWDRIEKEKIQSQFETLKSQVNPHFLFNSFNTLIAVIEENPETAIEYVEHLSDLYRKIVTYRDKDIITLKEELLLIHDYFFIQKKRFGDNLQLNISLPPASEMKYSIAPLTLQLLCENAVKHNAISAETPLAISISTDAEYLSVANKINPKYTVEKGAGMGLQNIQKRYALLSRKEVKIAKTEKEFIVRIPLLTTP